MSIHDEIDAIRNRLGKKLLILGHHYQREDVIVHTDIQGDSFQLSAAAADRASCDGLDCETIVFCGVHFMAETADILANSPENLEKRGGKRVDVLLPDLQAGCPMADMATRPQVEKCWKKLSEIIDTEEIVPVTYVNSSADLKAFCGEHGGLSCTSTNARAVLEWALSQKQRVLFFPDQHLGRNTALAMGLSETVMPLWRSDNATEVDSETKSDAPSFGGNDAETIKNSRIILWNGYCNVHQNFTLEQIEAVKAERPGIRVIVHPECCRAVVKAADEAGSTSYILNRITESPAGSAWAVGTEGQFVQRLKKNNPDKTIVNLSSRPSYCETMSLIDPVKLAAVLNSIETDRPVNVIRVENQVAAPALSCLRRMLQCR